MRKEIKTEIGVIGGGAAGLMVTKKLSELGYGVTLVEKQSRLANGPSVRNEGWLHRGAYHAAAIEDPEKARRTVQQVVYGHEQILSYAPEAVEDITSSTFALVRDEKLAERAEQRWEEFGVAHKPLSIKELQTKAPEIDGNQVGYAYETKDLSVNFRVLYQKLLHTSERAGAQIMTGTKFIPEEENKAALELPDGSKASLSADLFICTTGLGAKDLFPDGTLGTIRFWKSHSITLPRLTEHSMFFIDPYEASIMQHGRFSIACQSEDDYVIPTPDVSVDEQEAKNVFKSLSRLLPQAVQYEDNYGMTSCVKPDIIQKDGVGRSVDNMILEPVPNYIVAFPGKATATPFMADKIINVVFDRKSDDRIAFRPGDMEGR